jgi:hypothetical protein
MLALFAITFMLPFYFEELRGFSVERSGLLLTPLPPHHRRRGARERLAGRSHWLALAVACLGLLFLARLDARSTLGEVIGFLVLTGVGQGMFQTPNSRALMNAVPPEEQGEASGLLATGAWSARASASRSRGPSSPASAAPRRVGRSVRPRPEPSPLETSRRCSRPFSLGSKAR